MIKPRTMSYTYPDGRELKGIPVNTPLGSFLYENWKIGAKVFKWYVLAWTFGVLAAIFWVMDILTCKNSLTTVVLPFIVFNLLSCLFTLRLFKRLHKNLEGELTKLLEEYEKGTKDGEI